MTSLDIKEIVDITKILAGNPEAFRWASKDAHECTIAQSLVAQAKRIKKELDNLWGV